MKTTEEWFSILHCGTDELANKIPSVLESVSREDIKAILLDGWKQGMTDAAGMAYNRGFGTLGDEIENQRDNKTTP